MQMLSDELAIDRLERAHDQAMSRYGNGMYDPEEEMQISISITGKKPKILIPGKTDAFGDPIDENRR
jgi:hypothetical protein